MDFDHILPILPQFKRQSDFNHKGSHQIDEENFSFVDDEFPEDDANELYTMDEHPSIMLAMDENEEIQLPDHRIQVIEDEILQQDVVEVVGTENMIIFPCDCILPILVLYAKHMGQYFSFEAEVLDDTSTYRVINISNATSIARIQTNRCVLPLEGTVEQDAGWKYIPVNLEKVLHAAYGTKYLSCRQIRVKAMCRLYKIYFQDQAFSEAELPHYLKVVA